MSDKGIVMIVSIEGDDVDIEDFGPGVKWVKMPRETFDRIIYFLEHPETGVQLGRPRRRRNGSDTDDAGNTGPGGAGGGDSK